LEIFTWILNLLFWLPPRDSTFPLEVPFAFLYTDRMKNKNTVKHLIGLMEEAGESSTYIIGWLSSMIQANASGYVVEGYTIQNDIDSGVKYYTDKALLAGRMENIQKVCNQSTMEELYA